MKGVMVKDNFMDSLICIAQMARSRQLSLWLTHEWTSDAWRLSVDGLHDHYDIELRLEGPRLPVLIFSMERLLDSIDPIEQNPDGASAGA